MIVDILASASAFDVNWIWRERNSAAGTLAKHVFSC